jgi:hypothetical protein
MVTTVKQLLTSIATELAQMSARQQELAQGLQLIANNLDAPSEDPGLDPLLVGSAVEAHVGAPSIAQPISFLQCLCEAAVARGLRIAGQPAPPVEPPSEQDTPAVVVDAYNDAWHRYGVRLGMPAITVDGDWAGDFATRLSTLIAQRAAQAGPGPVAA